MRHQFLSQAALIGVLATGFVTALPTEPVAQQFQGVPGAPGTLEFPDSRVLPVPTPSFTGDIQPNLIDSKPSWPSVIAPPKGAPNVLLILIDDAGFGSNSAFGGLVPTPTIEKLAARGLRYTQMHNTVLCSPTRAALLTGRNHHAVGFGNIAEAGLGYPGYDTVTGPDSAHAAMTPSILNRSYTITADIEVPQGGANGVLVTQGGRFAGYGLYLKDGKPTFTYNALGVERIKWQSPEALPPGKHSIVFDWKMDPKGMAVARAGTGTLSIDGKQVAQRSLPKTLPFIWQWDETFDVGLDTGSPVDDADYEVPFAFTGTLGQITFDLGDTSVNPESIKTMMEELAQKRDR